MDKHMANNHPLAALLFFNSSDEKLLAGALDSGMIKDIHKLKLPEGEPVGGIFFHILKRFACEHGEKVEIIKRLLELGADLRCGDPDGDLKDSLDVMLQFGSGEAMAVVLEHADDKLKKEITTRKRVVLRSAEDPLPWPHAIAEEGRHEVLKAILGAGVEILDLRDEHGRTALFLGRNEAAEMVEMGFDPYAQDNDGIPSYTQPKSKCRL